MTTRTDIGLAYSRECRTAASGSDRTITLHDLTITLTFPSAQADVAADTLADTTEQWAVFSEWLDRHMLGVDLAYAFLFPPSVSNVAAYLAEVAKQVAPAAVGVIVTDGPLTVTATRVEVAP